MDLSQLTGAGNRRRNHNVYPEQQGMKIKTYLLFAIAWTVVPVPKALAQRGIEVASFIGGQTNGGLDLSTALYNRIEVQN